MIAVIDYGMGNLKSVEKGFIKAGVSVTVTNKADIIEKADAIVLPGVGAFRDCMRELSNLGLINAIVDSIKKGKPYLGICLGLQILFTESEEFGVCKGLDIFNGRVPRFPHNGLKVPHMGWNEVKIKRDNPLLQGVTDKSFLYFVHSFYVAPEDSSIVSTTTDYGIEFTSMVHRGNIFATQFHPEKSQAIGLRILKNFGDIVNRRQKSNPI
ncbi:MAG: imidazole glycerol phosphate synthase subunit HisH [Nitrospirae bacterium]|nr:imidazole glycerol phosphate synthase subunit HisH [Nitrospirota bacterium]